MATDEKKSELAEADYVSGMKYKDIAEKYDVSINTVKSWKRRFAWCRKGAPKNKKVCTQNKKVQNESSDKSVEDVIENEELTEKQRLFCIYYIKCFNATKAYKKAYQCEYNTAMVNGSRMLRNAKVKNEIQSLKQNRINRDMLSEDDIFQKYMDIAFADISDYVEIRRGHPIFKDSSEFDGTLVKKVTSGKTNSIELKDSMKALQWLSDHMDLATEKQKAEIAALRAKSGDDSGEEREHKQQAKDNIANILKQMREVNEEDVLE